MATYSNRSTGGYEPDGVTIVLNGSNQLEGVGGVPPDSSIGLVKLDAIAALSLVGNATNASADPTAIAAGTDGHVMRRAGTALAFGVLAAGAFANNTMPLATIANQAALTVMANATNGSAAVTAVAAANDGEVFRRSGTALGFGTLASGAFANNTISLARLANISGPGVLGRATVDSGQPQLISASAAADGDVLTVQADGSLAWEPQSGGGGGSIDGSGTATHLTSWTDANTVQASGITLASNVFTHAAAGGGAPVGLLVHNTNDQASATAQIEARVAGSTASNPRVRVNINALRTLDLIIDNAATDEGQIRQDDVPRVRFYGTGGTVITPSGGGGGASSGSATLEVTTNAAEAASLWVTQNFGNQSQCAFIRPYHAVAGHGMSLVTSGSTNAFGNVAGASSANYNVITNYGVVDGLLIGGDANGGELALFTNATRRVVVAFAGNIGLGNGLATTDTAGDVYIPSCAGVPTGVPTGMSNLIPLRADRTNNKLYIYSGGAWVALN